VDEVLSTLATLFETAHNAGVLPIKAVTHLRASPLLLHYRLLQDVSSLQRVNEILEYYLPHTSPLPEFTPHEAEMLSN